MEAKKQASLEDGAYWILCYDACMAYIWRTQSRHSARLSKPDRKQNSIWWKSPAEALP